MLKFFIMFFRRFFFIFTLISLLSLISPIPLSAQSENILKEKQDAINKGTNQESWLNEAMSSNIVSTLQVLTGPIPDAVLTGQAVTFIPSGALGTTTNLIASLYSPPASGIEYLADLWHSKFLGKPAYAQGIGFRGLQPILPIWRGFRNVVYLLSSIVFVVIGIMIILRVKISPQAVVSIQSAIPQLITTLILVTFSYAIAGLLIDLMTLFQALSIATLFQVKNIPFSQNLVNPDPVGKLTNPYTFSKLIDGSLGDVASLTFLALPKMMVLLLSAVVGAIVAIGVISIPMFSAAAPLAPILGGIGFVVIFLIINIAILISLLKFFFGLIKCYVSIILNIILAPLQIGLGAFPGIKTGFSSWIISLIANLSVFPLSLLFLLLANMIIDSARGSLWAPSMISASAPGLITSAITSLSGGIIPVAIGFYSIMLLSKLPELIPQAIFNLKPSPFTPQGPNLGPLPAIAAWEGGIAGLNLMGSEKVLKRLIDPYNRFAGALRLPKVRDTSGIQQAMGLAQDVAEKAGSAMTKMDLGGPSRKKP